MATGSGIDFVTQVSIVMINVFHYFIYSKYKLVWS